MKTLALLFFSLLVTKGCSSQDKKDLEKAQITYIANTRGFFQKIIITNHKAFISKDRNGKDTPIEIAINDKDWNELVQYFNSIDLNQLAKLKDPTQKRFYDGAAIANLKINYKDKQYETSSFDHGFPPAEIKNIVDKIVSFVKDE